MFATCAFKLPVANVETIESHVCVVFFNISGKIFNARTPYRKLDIASFIRDEKNDSCENELFQKSGLSTFCVNSRIFATIEFSSVVLTTKAKHTP